VMSATLKNSLKKLSPLRAISPTLSNSSSSVLSSRSQSSSVGSTPRLSDVSISCNSTPRDAPECPTDVDSSLVLTCSVCGFMTIDVLGENFHKDLCESIRTVCAYRDVSKEALSNKQYKAFRKAKDRLHKGLRLSLPLHTRASAMFLFHNKLDELEELDVQPTEVVDGLRAFYEQRLLMHHLEFVQRDDVHLVLPRHQPGARTLSLETLQNRYVSKSGSRIEPKRLITHSTRDLLESFYTAQRIQALSFDGISLCTFPLAVPHLFAGLERLNLSRTVAMKIGDEINELRSLRVLTACTAGLQYIPELHLPALTRCDLSDNALQSVPRWHCPMLRMLSLSKNALRDLDDFLTIGCPAVVLLKLSDNMFQEVPRWLNKCSNLHLVDLSNNALALEYTCDTPFRLKL